MSHVAMLLSFDLLLTILIEMIAAYGMGVRSFSDQLLIAGINGVTNPIAHVLYRLAYGYVSSLEYGYFFSMGLAYGALAVLELLVIWTEYKFLRRYLISQVRPLRLSMVMNIASAAAGLLADHFLWM